MLLLCKAALQIPHIFIADKCVHFLKDLILSFIAIVSWQLGPFWLCLQSSDLLNSTLTSQLLHRLLLEKQKKNFKHTNRPYYDWSDQKAETFIQMLKACL